MCTALWMALPERKIFFSIEVSMLSSIYRFVEALN